MDRLWTTSPDTEIIDGIEYRNVWQKNDEQAKRDAEALGASVTRPDQNLPQGFWSSNLAVAAYDGPTLIAIAPGEVRFSDRLRVNMAYLRVFVAPEHRERGVVIPLTMKFHEVMRRHAQDNPRLRIGGTMAMITVKGMLDEPIGHSGMILVGYTPRNEPLIVRWFEGFKL
jgi:hypothetical protein